MKFLALFFFSFSAFAQITISDPQDLLTTQIDPMVISKKSEKLFPCGARATFRRPIAELSYKCFKTYCEIDTFKMQNFSQPEVTECSEGTRYIVDTSGNYSEVSDEYLKSIKFNLVRYFLTETLAQFFPENGVVEIKKVAPSEFVQFKGFPFERKTAVTSIFVTYYPVKDMYGLDLEIKYNPKNLGLTQIVEFSIFEDLWSEFAF